MLNWTTSKHFCSDFRFCLYVSVRTYHGDMCEDGEVLHIKQMNCIVKEPSLFMAIFFCRPDHIMFVGRISDVDARKDLHHISAFSLVTCPCHDIPCMLLAPSCWLLLLESFESQVSFLYQVLLECMLFSDRNADSILHPRFPFEGWELPTIYVAWPYGGFLQ